VLAGFVEPSSTSEGPPPLAGVPPRPPAVPLATCLAAVEPAVSDRPGWAARPRSRCQAGGWRTYCL